MIGAVRAVERFLSADGKSLHESKRSDAPRTPPAQKGRFEMDGKRTRRPTPAFVVAMIALFVALGGTAGAVATQAVPLAKRALVADNAKKLGGQTSGQVAAQAARAALALSPAGPRPASSAAGLVAIKTGTGTIGPDGIQQFSVTCDAGQKVLGGGFSTNELVLGFDSWPSSDTTWSFFLGNLSPSAPANVTLYATCLR
jgi:hypothetical protein